MEILKEKIKRFLQLDIGYGSGDGDGDGSGSGDGDGSGSGSGYGSGYGYGYGDSDGYGDGSGSGYGSGYGSGSSSGYGYGDSSGSGYGYGYGSGVTSFNGKKVYLIDNVQTIIQHIYNNLAKGYILNTDFTLEKCYIAKGNNKFAHGKTSKEAIQSLQEKIFEDMDVEEAIEEFKKKFENGKKYKGTEFYTWHHILTGSCKMGRDSFVKNHELNLDKKYSVKEFIEVCENDYGSQIIQKLKKYYK